MNHVFATPTIRFHHARRRVRHRRTLGSAWRRTEQSAIGLDDGNPPPGIATKTFAYNAANRMASVSENGELLMSYRYNGQGERVYRSGSGQTAHTVFDPNGQWIGDYDEYGQVIQQAIWLDNLPVGLLARLDGGERRVFYIQPDALGTPRVVIDPTRGTQGTAVWRWELEDEAFGETDPDQDPDGDNTLFVLDMRYPGQQHDSATGFNYNYFRDYDASIGRYVQSDPVGLVGGVSLYSYVDAGPLDYSDPLGLTRWKGSVTIASAHKTLKLKIKPPGNKIPPVPVGKLEVSYARATINLESDCIKGQKFVFSMTGEVELSKKGWLPTNFSRFNVELFDNNDQPQHLDLVGNFFISATGYHNAGGTVSIGVASGKITGGWNTMGEFTAKGAMELTPFTGIASGTGLVRCTCED